MNRGKKILIEDEEDEEPFHIANQTIPNDATISMCLIGKLWTGRSFNTYGLMDTMKRLCNPAKGVTCRELGQNMISFQFQSKKDMNRVLSMEPWHFNKQVLVLKPIMAETQPGEMEFNTVRFWIRIYDLPFSGRDEETIRQIGERFGKVSEIDKDTITGVSRSIRIRVEIRIDKPLKRGTKIKIGNKPPTWLPITYERLPTFCYLCGMLGHLHKDCPSTQDEEEKEEIIDDDCLPYGDWMRASPLKITRGLNERDGDAKDNLRRSLFAPKNTDQKKNLKTDEKETHESPQSAKQLSELLDSLEKVGVSDKE